MKKLLLYALSLFAGAQLANSQVIFDPATFDQTKLLAGMSIIDKDGQKVLQVILDEWNSTLNLPSTTLGTGQTAKVSYFKYAKCAATTTTNPINGVVQIMDTVNKVPASWNAAQMVPSSTGIGQFPVTTTAGPASAAIDSRMKIVHQVQFFGQEQGGSWGPTKGDTMWVGKVRAITADNKVIFDPREADPSELTSDMKLDTIDGEVYVRAILNGWNSVLTIADSFDVTAAATQFTVKVKYAVGTSGFELSNINTFIKLANSNFGTEIAVNGSASSSTFQKYSADIKAAAKVGKFQFAGQEKTGWSAVSGDTLWFGKIALVDGKNPVAPETLTGTYDGTKVTLTWDAATDNDGIKEYIVKQGDVAIDTITKTTLDVKDLTTGTYTFSVIAVDKSGNKSAAKTVEVAVSGTGIVSANKEFGVYPNPAIDIITLKNAGKNIMIFDATGKVVINIKNTEENAVININNLKSGLYIVRNINDSNSSVTTFIKK